MLSKRAWPILAGLFDSVLRNPGGFFQWHSRRKRAICLGEMGYAKLWYDPKDGDIWQAKGRYDIYTDTFGQSLETAISVLGSVDLCELYVDPDDVRSSD